jgi:hypothetical protein
MRKDMAEKAMKRMTELSDEIIRTSELFQKGCDEKEYIQYRNGIGLILADILDYIMRPIFKEYPELTPEEIKK